jgi:hypothetical protein
MWRHDGRHVFGRVHGSLGSPFGHGHLDFRDEDALPSNRVERERELVPPRSDDDHFDAEAFVSGPQPVGHQIGLPARQG